MKAPVAIAGMLLAIVSLGASGTPDRDRDVAAIATLIEEMQAANNDVDVEKWVGLFADDAVYMAPGAPAVTTREELTAVARAGFRNDASIDIEPVEIQVCDDWAFARTEVSGTVTVRDSGKVVAVDVKEILILRRADDGGWRVARLINNSNKE